MKKREMNACNSPLYPVEKKLKTCLKNMKFEVKMRRVIDDDFCDQRASISKPRIYLRTHNFYKGIIKIEFLFFIYGIELNLIKKEGYGRKKSYTKGVILEFDMVYVWAKTTLTLRNVRSNDEV